MPRRPAICRCALVLAWGTLVGVCDAGSADWLRTQLTIRWISEGAERYRARYGDWPRTDAESTWMRKLVDSELITPEALNSTATTNGEYGPPLDDWGREIAYSPPPGGQNAGNPLVRSFGENGIDEGGAGDDLTHGRGINPGFYWKRHYQRGWIRLAAFGALIAGLAGLTLRLGRSRRRLMVELCVLVFGLGLAVSMPSFSPNMTVSLPGHNPLAEWLCVSGWLIVLGLAAHRIGMCVRTRLGLARPRAAGECLVCGDDLTGAAGDKCPECGSCRAADQVSSRS